MIGPARPGSAGSTNWLSWRPWLDQRQLARRRRRSAPGRRRTSSPSYSNVAGSAGQIGALAWRHLLWGLERVDGRLDERRQERRDHARWSSGTSIANGADVRRSRGRRSRLGGLGAHRERRRRSCSSRSALPGVVDPAPGRARTASSVISSVMHEQEPRQRRAVRHFLEREELSCTGRGCRRASSRPARRCRC